MAIVKYDSGNVDSVCKAVSTLGAKPVLTDDENIFKIVDACILPGVGAFGDAMGSLRRKNLPEILKQHIVDEGVPLLGICLGMHLLASKGFEHGEHEGLEFIPGTVEKMKPLADECIPHVGWNNVEHKGHALFEDIAPGKDFYFVHSYHFAAQDDSNILATTPYCGNFTSVVGKGNIFGAQFHPEKSQATGMQLLKNFLNMEIC
ncbi:imidazole glycerol phosphate synthase subunit HisH [Marinifilum sp. JC120]|nr:imidazole glycerol phosphate synthase subunit HisH [Marinifilum sp. JC120]